MAKPERRETSDAKKGPIQDLREWLQRVEDRVDEEALQAGRRLAGRRRLRTGLRGPVVRDVPAAAQR